MNDKEYRKITNVTWTTQVLPLDVIMYEANRSRAGAQKHLTWLRVMGLMETRDIL